MAGLRQYSPLATTDPGYAPENDVLFNIFDRSQQTRLMQYAAAQNTAPIGAPGRVVELSTAAAVNNLIGGIGGDVIGTNSLNVSAVRAFDKTAGALGPGFNDHRVIVIRGINFTFTAGTGFRIGGSTAAQAAGTHLVFINCSFAYEDALEQAGIVWMFRNGEGGFADAFAPGYVAGDDSSRINDIASLTAATSRSINFFGCSINITSNTSAAVAGSSLRFAVGEMHDTLVNVHAAKSGAQRLVWPFFTPGTRVENSFIQATGNNPQTALNFTGAVELSGVDTRGFSTNILDLSTIKAFGSIGLPGAAIASFNSGSFAAAGRDANTTRSFYKSVDSQILINPAATSVDTANLIARDDAIDYTAGGAVTRANYRYIELLRYSPICTEDLEGNIGAAGISYQLAGGVDFSNGAAATATAPENWTAARVTGDTGYVAPTASYVSVATGHIAGTGYIPDTGRTDGTIVADLGANGGLQIPVDVYRKTSAASNGGGSTRINPGDTTITARSFWHNLSGLGADAAATFADGQSTVTLNKANLVTRSQSAAAGSSIDQAGVTTGIDPTLGSAVRAHFNNADGTVNNAKTAAALTAYYDGAFTGTEGFTDQDASDALKALHYGYETGLPFRAVDESTDTTSATLNLVYTNGGTSAYVWDNATSTVTLRGHAAGSADGEPVQSLAITGSVDFDGQTIEGANISATTLLNLSTTIVARGGSLAGAFTPTTANPTLVFENDADGNGVDLSGFTATAPVTITGRIAVAPTNNANITQPQSITLTGFEEGSYFAAYDITNATTGDLLSTLTTTPAAGNIPANTSNILVGNRSTGDQVRIVITNRDHEDFIINHTVSGVESENILTVVQRPQAVPADPTDVTGISLTTAIAAGTRAATTLNITINGATASVASGNSLSDTQSYGFLARAKNTPAYNQLVAERNDATVQRYQPAGVESPGGFFAPAVLIIPGTPDFQQLGFVNPVRPAGDTTSVLADDIAAGAGVLILPTSSFDLPLTVSSLTNVVSSQAYIDDVTNPAINAIRNFLQLSDN